VPVFENRVALEIARGIKVFLNVQAGVTRNGAAELAPKPSSSRESGAPARLKQAGQRIASKGRVLRAQARRHPGREEVAGGVRAENVVWIFGAARTGSTWLSRMMGEMKGQTVWREPLVGALFGNLYYDRAKHLIGKGGKHYILGDGYRDSWLNSIRTFVLKEASGRFPEAAGPDRYLVIKEPNGSFGAPLLMEALPESSMILLIRDPRDAVASSMDAKREGSWHYENRKKWMGESPVDKNPDAYVRRQAETYLQRISIAKQAYEAHEGRKVLVRYEELRADALGTMRRIYSELGIPVDEGKLAQAVEKHSWENIPEEEKGEGKTFRKATPGGWREDLTPEQAEIVERITAPLLKEFYPDNAA
jgi:hypothetical protein